MEASGFGSIVRLSSNSVYKGFLEEGLPTKIGSYFKNGVLIYTGEIGFVEADEKNATKHNLVFKEDFHESFVEKFEQKKCLVGY